MKKTIFTLAVFAAALFMIAQQPLKAAQVEASVISVDGGVFSKIHLNGQLLTPNNVYARVEYCQFDEGADPIVATKTVGFDLWLYRPSFTGVSGTPTDIEGVVKTQEGIQPYFVENVLNVKGASQIEVFDLTGKSLVKVKNTESVDLSTLNKGIYLVSVVVDGKSTTCKIVKK